MGPPVDRDHVRRGIPEEFAECGPGRRDLLQSVESDLLLRPRLIDTCRRLFRNVGLRIIRRQALGAESADAMPTLVTLVAAAGG